MRVLALGALLSSCAPPSPTVAPSPRADTIAPESTPRVAAPLPPIPRATGALAIRVVYPAPNHLIESRDSNFVLGSVGNGDASLTINGAPARVYPNGAFLAFVANPPSTAARYDLVATLNDQTERLTLPVRVSDPRPVVTPGTFAVDTASVTPRAPATPGTGASPMLVRADERIRVAVRASGDATVWVSWTSGSQPLTSASADSSTGASWTTDLAARALRDGATLYVARGADTARFALLRPDLVDSIPIAQRWLRVGALPVRPDTDLVINARPTPGGTYKWFILPGTLVELTGRMQGFTRVRLDSSLEVWINDGDAVPMPAGTPAPRRVAVNARVRPAVDWVDLVIPIIGGERPAYQIAEEGRTFRLTLYNVRGNTDIVNYVGEDTLVRTVEWTQPHDDRMELAVQLRQQPYGYLVMWDGGSLVFRIRRVPRIDPHRPLHGLTIAVDPGHPPAGATGPTGLYEGVVTLPIGEKLKALLEERGATVFMTRTTNDPLDLNVRPVLARRAGAHAFVSIHLNAYGDGVNIFNARNGSGTYFFRQLSEPLARPVQRSLVRQLGLPDLGVYYDNLAVVRPAWMPSVLTEGAFVIVPEQEAALRTDEFQERYARGIADGIEDYFRWLSRQ